MANNIKPGQPFNGVGSFLTRRSGGSRINIQDVITYVYLILGAVVMFGPVVWLIMSSFKDKSLLFEKNPTFLPYRQTSIELFSDTLLQHDFRTYRITVGDAHIDTPDIAATNGYLQVIKEIRLPSALNAAVKNLAEVDEDQLPSGMNRVALDGETGNLLAMLQDEREYSIFAEMIHAAGLDEILSSEDAYTVLVFDDDAFEDFARKIGEEHVAALMLPENQALLMQIMQSHILEGRLAVLDIFNQRNDTLPTLYADNSRRVNVSQVAPLLINDVTVNNLLVNGSAQIVISDLQASNGMVHGLDHVLLTPAMEAQLANLSGDAVEIPAAIPLSSEDGNLLEVAQANSDLTIAAALLAAASLDDVATGEGERTFLAPTNAAFAALAEQYGAGIVGALLDNPDILHDFMAYHVLSERLRAVNLFRSFAEPVATRLDDLTLSFSMTPAQTLRLAQVGSPKGAEFFFIDPDHPEAGVISLFSYATPQGDSVVFDPIREVHFSMTNYTEPLDLEAFKFWVYLKNSVVVTIAATIVTLIVNSMAAFGLSKYKFAGRDLVFVIIISTLMVPVSVILIPAFIVISEVGWVNSLWGLIIPGAATPTGVFLLRQYMLTIPDELLDAARIDGASEFRIYYKIILPLARPAMAVLAIFSIMWRWNDFLWPLIVVSRNDKFTLQVGLNAFQGALDVQWHYILAMTVLTLLPITVVFAFLQQYITSGIATTGLK